MYTCNILAVTNRRLCLRPLTEQVKRVCALDEVKAVLLREKDMTEHEYLELARGIAQICAAHDTMLIMHTFTDAARELGCNRIHLPMPLLRKYDIRGFETVGASVHSVEEAMQARSLGATYITAGHIFATDCKKGVPPRGTAFLKDICESVDIPVYAIGGITPQNVPKIKKAGAYGAAVMSQMMKI